LSNPEPVEKAPDIPGDGPAPSAQSEPAPVVPETLAEHCMEIARVLNGVDERVTSAVDYVIVHLRDLSKDATELSRGLMQLTARSKADVADKLTVDAQRLFELISQVPCESITDIIHVKMERHDQIFLDDEE
jgi:hypothetical protein